MVNPPPSESGRESLEFADRRKQRKQELRGKFFKNKSPVLKTGWRVFVSSGLLATGVWVVSLPLWNLTDPSQIEVLGTRLLSNSQIKEKISIDYPQYIFRLQPQAIAAQLEKKAPVYDVVVKRSLFPLKVIVIVQEREPVARTVLNNQAGFIDIKGVWIAAKSYPEKLKKPELVVLGTNQTVLQVWRKLYTQISQSPVKISKLDFRNSSNLILTTDLGLVYCGAYTYNKMEKQIQMLGRLRSLPKSANLKFTHIDLINPDFPVVDGVTPLKPNDLKP
jgi:cell division protein FtsQ